MENIVRVFRSWLDAHQEVDDMQPYLDQHPKKDVDTIHTILVLFLKFNEGLFPCTGHALS